MRQRRGVEIAPAIPAARICDEAGIGPPRKQPELHDLAARIQVIVDSHLLPVEDAKIAGLAIVLAAEREIRVAYRLQEHPRHALAVCIEDLNVRIQPRFLAGRAHLEYPGLAGLGREAVEIGIGHPGAATVDRASDLSRKRHAIRLIGGVVRFVFGGLMGRAGIVRRDQSRRSWRGGGGGLDWFAGRNLKGFERTVHPPDLERSTVGPECQRGRHVRLIVPELQFAIIAGSPGLDRAVFGQRNEPGAIARESEPDDGRVVREPRNHHRVNLGPLARNKPPNSDVVVGPRGDDRAAIGAERARVFGFERLW